MAKTYRKVAEFKTVEDFSAYLKSENINIGLVPEVPADGSAALARKAVCKGRTIGNRWAILPMEGWDCMADGTPSEFTRRRWLNFAASGAKLLYGTEAAAVMHSGRSNPRQLLVADHTADALASICAEMRLAHKDRFGRNDDLVIGLQLTHSGRYSHPNKPDVLESKTAYSHPLLDKKFGNDASNVVTDEEVGEIVRHFIKAAVIAQKAGFDFVDQMTGDKLFGKYLRTALFEEVFPTVQLPDDEKKAFAESIIERFLNPFANHQLISISLNSISKWQVRVLPSLIDYEKINGKLPKVLAFSFAALLSVYRGTVDAAGHWSGKRAAGAYPIRDDAEKIAFLNAEFDRLKQSGDYEAFIRTVMARTDFWGMDLNTIPGFTARAAADLRSIDELGITSAVEKLLEK